MMVSAMMQQHQQSSMQQDGGVSPMNSRQFISAILSRGDSNGMYPNFSFQQQQAQGNFQGHFYGQSTLASLELPDSNRSDSMDEGQNADESQGSNKLQARLERNRATARLRRERKKQEAELLTKFVAGLKLRASELMASFSNLDEHKRMEARRTIKSFGDPPVPCMFCTNSFSTEVEAQGHMSSAHRADLKAREQFLEESRKFGLTADGNEIKRSLDKGRSMRMTSEERKKRRLERNAASARLCRQRKKLYIENLRSQIPGLRHRVRAVEAALPRDVVNQIREKTPLPESLLDTDTEQEHKIMERKSSKSMEASSESDSCGESTGSRGQKRRTSAVIETNVLVGEAETLKKINVEAANIPPLNGWSRSQKRDRRGSISSESASGTASPMSTTTSWMGSPPTSTNPSLSFSKAGVSAGYVQPTHLQLHSDREVLDAALGLHSLGKGVK